MRIRHMHTRTSRVPPRPFLPCPHHLARSCGRPLIYLLGYSPLLDVLVDDDFSECCSDFPHLHQKPPMYWSAPRSRRRVSHALSHAFPFGGICHIPPTSLLIALRRYVSILSLFPYDSTFLLLGTRVFVYESLMSGSCSTTDMLLLALSGAS
jgi:hypothetical protein